MDAAAVTLVYVSLGGLLLGSALLPFLIGCDLWERVWLQLTVAGSYGIGIGSFCVAAVLRMLSLFTA